MADGMMAAQPANAKPQPGYDESKTPLETLVSWVEEAEETTDAARKAAERDRDYYDGKQLTAAEKAELRKRGQPDIIINRIKPKVDYLMGFEAANRTDPRAFPRTPQDEEASEAATDALRFIKDRTELDQSFSNVWQNMLIDGYGGLELVIEPGPNGTSEIAVKQWEWDRLFYDPHSRKLDFSDARYLGGYVWMDEEEAEELADTEEGKEAVRKTVNETSFTQTYDDRPRWKTWVSGKGRKRVRIVQIYHREGGRWMHCTFTKGGKISSIPVPFVDQDGMSWCPLLLQSAYVDRDNNRYGLVRMMIDVQDEINKRRSKALHRLTMQQVLTENGAVDDVDLAKQEMAKPDGFVTVNPGFRFELLNKGEQLAGELNLLQEAKNEIEQMGPNASMQGKDGDAPSGRAILANQQSGQTELTLLMDRHRHLKKRTYQRIWDMIRQYKNEEWWVRVTDNEKNVRFVGLNRKVTAREELAKRLQAQGAQPQEIQAMLGQVEQDPMRGPMLDQVVRVENQPTEMWMDITIEEVPDAANVQEEQFQALIKLAPAVTFPPTVYLKASSLRNKDELLQELEGAQKSPEQAAQEQIVTELQIKKATAEVEKIIADVEKTEAEAIKIKVEADNLQLQVAAGAIVPPAIAGEQSGQQDLVPASSPPDATGVPEDQMPPQEFLPLGASDSQAAI
jgi:hypothetical protein